MIVRQLLLVIYSTKLDPARTVMVGDRYALEACICADSAVFILGKQITFMCRHAT